MNKEQKTAVVEELSTELKDADAIFAIDYRGISVPQAAELRSGLRDADARFRVVKNRLTLLAADKAGTKGHQVHKFSPKGEKLLSLGVAGKASNADGEFNQPNDVVVGPDGSIYVADGHEAQGMITANAFGKATQRPPPPSTSQVSLPSQKGATEFII